MEEMKAILCARYGAPEVLKISTAPKPRPRKDQILVRIYSASVTNSDLFIRSSNVALRFLIPMRLMLGVLRPRNPILGQVFAGKIEAVGSEIRRFKVGDEVYGLTGLSLGAYADYKCMKEVDSMQGCVALKPPNCTFEDATSAAYGGLLALQALETGNIRRGHKVLVYGASGTSGTIAIQWAKHFGTEVTGVCGPSHVDFVRSLGAEQVLDYSDSGSMARLQKYDFILDAVGRARTSALKEACKNALTATGKYVSIDDDPLLLRSDRLARIGELVSSGVVTPITDRIYSFEQIVEAHKYVEKGHKRGNVAITIHAAP